MNKFEIHYSKALKLLFVIVISIFAIISISMFANEIYKAINSDYTLGKLFSASIFIMFETIVLSALCIVIFRRKIIINSDKITVQKTFSKSEYNLNQIHKVTAFTRYGIKPKSEFSVFKDKHTYFKFSEDMTNSDLLIDILINRGFIYRKNDGSYETLL